MYGATETDKQRNFQRDIDVYNKEFDRGRTKIPIGKFTLVGNTLTDYETMDDRKISPAGIAEIYNLFPAKLVFDRLIKDKKKLRVLSEDRNGREFIDIEHPEGTKEKNWLRGTFLKTEDDYKLISFWIRDYSGSILDWDTEKFDDEPQPPDTLYASFIKSRLNILKCGGVSSSMELNLQ
jgi:hypothetical protein